MKRLLAVLPGSLGLRCRGHLDALRCRGVLVMAGESPSAAISLAQVCRPDIVVAGLSMPGMEGLEMVVLLQKQHELTMPIVVLPDVDDPLDPLVCTCEPRTGRFNIEHYPADQIWIRIAELCGLEVETAAQGWSDTPVLVPG
jgi:CheY-like chemotaxis protein